MKAMSGYTLPRILNIYKTEKDILDKVLDQSKYDLRIVARHYNETTRSTEPVIVRTNMYIRGIEYISVDKMEYKIQMTFRQQWTDDRLKFDDMKGQIKYLVLDDPNRIWIPDTFFSNSRFTLSHTDIRPNLLFRIYPNGNVLFSKRMTATLACPMDLKYFPFDRQICSIQMASWSYTTDDMVLLWKEGDPVQVTKRLNLNEFKLEKYFTEYCTSRTITGEYSCLKVDLKFTRITVKYLFQWFVTTAMLTFISFLSFLMKSSNSSRIKFLVAVLLMLYTHIVVINMWSEAKVSYFIAKDWWFMWCTNFIVAAIIEFAIVKAIDYNCNKNSNNHGHFGDNVALKTLETKECYDNCREKWRNSTFGRKIDLFCAVIFP
ncbi:unnamed protein product, partial [Medioppia subpectinata]